MTAEHVKLINIEEFSDLPATIGDADFIQWVEATGRFVGVSASSLIPAYRFQKGYLFGGALSNNVSDPTNDIDVSQCLARSDTDSVNIDTSGALTKRLDATFSAGSGNGMLDTGAVGNGTYHIFGIVGSGNGDILASLSPTSPTLPATFTQQRRIGSIVRAGGVILPFTQRGDEFILKTPVKDVDVATQSTSSVTYTLASIPTGIIVKAHIEVVAYRSGAASQMLVRALTDVDIAPSLYVSGQGNWNDPSAGSGEAENMEIYTNTSSQIAVRASAAMAQLVITSHGWTDTRGRLA